MEQPTKIVATVTTSPEKAQAGGAPVFVAENKENLQKISTSLEKILDASAHEIDSSIIIIVAH